MLAIRVGQALEQGIGIVVAGEIASDTFVDRRLVAQGIEDGVDVDVERAAAAGVDIAAKVEQLPQAHGIELQLTSGSHQPTRSRTTTGITRVVRFTYSS